MRGRTALYGPRHLQQLVAIKRWQAQGRSLSQIQADFVFLTPTDLTEASRVPEHLLADDVPESVPDVVHRPRFWADRPAMHIDRPATDQPTVETRPVETRPVETAPVHGVTLGGGAILLLPRPVTDTDRADIAAAAAPLMSLLETRGLIDGRTP
jgi:hypothetical protein